jgi:hypothetical protein
MRPLFTRVEFSWKVASNGYALSPLHSDGGANGTELQCRIVPLRGPTHQTKPFDKFPGLFRQFASMEATPSGALDFANKFGLLQAEQSGNALTLWLEQRAHFAELVANDASSSNGRRADALNSLNHILHSELSTEISAVGGIVVKPHTLLGAMAFQLGLWFEVGDNRIGQCAECGTTWEFGPGTGHRVNRRYCSMKCQEAAYYRRKKERRGTFWRQQGGQKKPPPV